LYLCRDDTGGHTFVSRGPACDDAGAPATMLLGYLGFAYSSPLLPDDHHYGDVVYSVEVFRCRHPDHGWSVVAGSVDACSDLGAGWSPDGSLGHLVPFLPGSPPAGD
ncbi:MAG: hypothetical protein ACE5LU_30340, partial [Anaerolineae bacterium]